MHVVISLLLQSRKFWWYLLLTSSMLLHDVIMMSYCCQRYAECLVTTLSSSRQCSGTPRHACQLNWCVKKRQIFLCPTPGFQTPQFSVLWITRVGLSCNIVSTTDKSTVLINWNGGSSMSGAILNSQIFDQAIDQWRGRHRAYVHAKGGQFEYSLWTDNVDFVHTCYIQCDLFDCCIFITKSCQQCWPIHSCSFYKVLH